MLSDSSTKPGRQSVQVPLVRQAEQLAVVHSSQGRVPSEVVPLTHSVQVLFSNPNPKAQLVQLSAARLQVLQVDEQAAQKKVELVNSVEAQASQVVLLRPKPSLHSRQEPSEALQVRQVVQLAQAAVPSEKVLEGQAAQVRLSGANPAWQVSQVPLVRLQVTQLELQLAQAVVPAKKIPTIHSEQIPLSKPKPSTQDSQTPLVLSQVLQLTLQAWQVALPPGEKVLLTHVSQRLPLIWEPAGQSVHAPEV